MVFQKEHSRRVQDRAAPRGRHGSMNRSLTFSESQFLGLENRATYPYFTGFYEDLIYVRGPLGGGVECSVGRF